MGAIDKSVSIKWNIIRAFGILLIVWSLFSILEANGLTQPNIAYDDPFACSRISENISHDTRIAWCISSTYLQGLGPDYNGGVTNLNETTIDGLKLRREEQTLFVENQTLQIGERYEVVRQTPFANPWLILTTHYLIVNNGLNLPEPSMSGINALYITGAVNEGWQPNPLGLIILVGGIALIVLGQSAMEPSIPLKIKTRDIAVGFFGWVIFKNLVLLLEMIAPEQGIFIIGLNWLVMVVTILVLFIKKKNWMCAGVVTAVIINIVRLWIFASNMSSYVGYSFGYYLFFFLGQSFPYFSF
jgi:hypothetical protein